MFEKLRNLKLEIEEMKEFKLDGYFRSLMVQRYVDGYLYTLFPKVNISKPVSPNNFLPTLESCISSIIININRYSDEV